MLLYCMWFLEKALLKPKFVISFCTWVSFQFLCSCTRSLIWNVNSTFHIFVSHFYNYRMQWRLCSLFSFIYKANYCSLTKLVETLKQMIWLLNYSDKNNYFIYNQPTINDGGQHNYILSCAKILLPKLSIIISQMRTLFLLLSLLFSW